MKTHFERNEYGEIIPYGAFNIHTNDYSQYLRDLYCEAKCLIQIAVQKKKLQFAYDDLKWDRKRRVEGEALHHEIYDISKDGRHVLICCRKTEGRWKYGVSTVSKDYYIISAYGKDNVKIQEAPKSKAAKAAKSTKENGDAILICLGKKKLSAPSLSKEICYKIAGFVDDTPVSVYDDSEWTIGKRRIEKASPDHDSGFYVFLSIETALQAWKERVVFKDRWLKDDYKYVLLECECYGRKYFHDSNKVCISAVKPLEIVAGLIL